MRARADQESERIDLTVIKTTMSYCEFPMKSYETVAHNSLTSLPEAISQRYGL